MEGFSGDIAALRVEGVAMSLDFFWCGQRDSRDKGYRQLK